VGGKPATSLPIAQWTHWGSYDTAKDCEDSSAKTWDMADKKGGIAQEMLFRARCIPADSIPVK
jgi:hypothetical protein